MLSRFLRPRTIWWPTWLGWLVLLVGAALPAGVWALKGERFLAVNAPLEAEVLIVEGWIGLDGMAEVRREFQRGGYTCIVTAGGPTGHRWSRSKYNYAISAADVLVGWGLPASQVIAAPDDGRAEQRTFGAAMAVRAKLAELGLKPKAVNVLSLGPHTRRSRLVYAKVLGDAIDVGSVAWWPEHYDREPWWRSSERGADFLKESVGYTLELFFSSGRWLKSADAAAPR